MSNKQWPAYERCPFYVPLCEHMDGYRDDIKGGCVYYWHNAGSCSEHDNCDGYGWHGMSHARTIKTRLDIVQQVGALKNEA